MRVFFFLILFLIISWISVAQTSFTIGGSVGTQLAMRNAIGLGGFTRLSWPIRTQVFRFVEGGFNHLQYQSNMYSGSFGLNHLRLNFGKRKFTVQESSGIYFDTGVGFYGVIPSGNGSLSGNFYPGGGAFLGLGFAKDLIMVGLQFHASYTTYEIALVPLFNVGINFNKRE